MDALVRGHGFAGGHAGGEVRRELETRFDRDGIEPLLAELDVYKRQAVPLSNGKLHKYGSVRRLGSVCGFFYLFFPGIFPKPTACAILLLCLLYTSRCV